MGKFSRWAKKLKPTPKPKETLAGKPVKERVSPRVHIERGKEKVSAITSRLKRPVNTKTGKPFGVNTKAYQNWAKKRSNVIKGAGVGVAGTALGVGGVKISSAIKEGRAKAQNISPKKMTYEPKKHVVPSKSKSYSIKSGDTLSQIAKRQGTTLKALLAANPSIKDPNKIRIGQKIKMSTPVKGRKSVYQGLSKSRMAGMAMPTVKKGKGGSLIRNQLETAIKKFKDAGGKISQIPVQTRKSAGIKERIPTPAERKHLQAELKRINDQIRSLERITARTGKAGSGSGMSRSGPAEFGTQMRGSGRVPRTSVEQKRGGAVMKKQVGGRMSRVGLSPAEMARAGVMSEARRKRYMNNAGTGVINRGKGGAFLKKEIEEGIKKFIEKGGKITKIKEAKPRTDYTAGPVKRKKKSKGGEKKPFVRKAGGVVRKRSGGTLLVASMYD